jgi:membrane-associated phospholipid phosphatase
MKSDETNRQPPFPRHHQQRSGWYEKFIVEERFVPASTRRRLYATSMILGATGLVVFLVLLIGVMTQTGFHRLDEPVNTWFVSRRSPAMTNAMTILAIIFGPIGLPIIVLAVIVLWAILARHAWRPLLFAAGMATGLLTAQLVIFSVRHPRPPIDLMLNGPLGTFSFPSGHVLNAADLLLILAYLIASRLQKHFVTILLFLLAAVGILAQIVCRLYLGYHWISDATASVALALVVLSAVMAVDTARTVRVPGERVEGKRSQVQVDGT